MVLASPTPLSKLKHALCNSASAPGLERNASSDRMLADSESRALTGLHSNVSGLQSTCQETKK